MKRTYDNPNSLANLKLGAASRKSEKERHCYTVKPETHQWLANYGNASGRLDELVGKILAGELTSINTVRTLEAEVDRLKLEVRRLKEKG